MVTMGDGNAWSRRLGSYVCGGLGRKLPGK